MKHQFPALLLSILAFTSAHAQDNKTKALTWQDIPNWSYFRTNAARSSSDGKWIAYQAGPTEGNLTLTLKSTLDTSSYHYKIGGQGTSVTFNEDSRFVAFYEAPDFKTIKSNQKSKKPSSKKLRIVSLKDTSSSVFDKVGGFDFSNEDGKWLAIRFESGGGGARNENAAKGADLLLYNLDNKQKFNIGNVNDYAFNKNGSYLAYTVDADGKNGNGVFLLNLKTGLTSALQNDEASFSKINWNKEGTAFSLLKSKEDKAYKKPVYTLLAVKNLDAKSPEIYAYSGLQEEQITAGYGISENTVPYWSKDLSTIFFGIAKLEKKDDKDDKDDKDKSPEAKVDSLAQNVKNERPPLDSVATKRDSSVVRNAANRPARGAAPNKKDLEKPDMIIWNWQDKRLQSSQQKQLERDKRFTIMSSWQVAADKFVSLADSNVKSIRLAPNQTVGYGLDYSPYEYTANLDGQNYADLYLIDIKSGTRKLAVEKLYLNASRTLDFSPLSTHLLYYSDGHFRVLDVKTLATTVITDKIPSSFVDIYDDHNVTKPATRSYGWSQDGRYVLLKDNFDLWKVSYDGKSSTKLTDNWAKEKLTVTSYSNIYPDDEDIDLTKDQYFGVLNTGTKQTGIALLPAKSNKIEILKLDDVAISPIRKAEHADAYFYTTESSNQTPELYVSRDNRLKTSDKLVSDTNTHILSAGSKLISYVSAHGDTLQAVLYLPADYEAGKSYPTITYIYERLTDSKNAYSQPSFPGGGFNRAMYTSNGYAVLMPDIKYKLNDPGMSAVACVIPAVEAAVATGIVDEKNVAIHGHSWGGYQTAFLITQTDIFKAAIAGAPLTNMISMYSLIYWNSGTSNQSIFESSQGRLTSGYWDNWDAYARNSPIFHIKNVKTPLVILHNDKDGAVDYTQGIEYFNGLRRLNKPVVMLTYNGENHGLMKEVNKKDYAVRMMEYFDHYLKGKVAPDWWAKGIDYVDLSKHLEERAF